MRISDGTARSEGMGAKSYFPGQMVSMTPYVVMTANIYRKRIKDYLIHVLLPI